MKNLSLGSIKVYRLSEFPRTVVGFSWRSGVLVLWDEDYDTRVVTYLDTLPPWDLERVVAIHEHEGSCDIWLRDEAPFSAGGAIELVGDAWPVTYYVPKGEGWTKKDCFEWNESK